VLATLNQFLMEQHDAGRKVAADRRRSPEFELISRAGRNPHACRGVESAKEKGAAHHSRRAARTSTKKLNLTGTRSTHPAACVCGFHLTRASRRAETMAYIDHRLEVAGAEDGAYFARRGHTPIIYKYTGGVPRLINKTLCDTCMMAALRPPIRTPWPWPISMAAIRELQWVEFAFQPPIAMQTARRSDLTRRDPARSRAIGGQNSCWPATGKNGGRGANSNRAAWFIGRTPDKRFADRQQGSSAGTTARSLTQTRRIASSRT